MISIIVVSAGERLWDTLTVPALHSLRAHCETGDFELIVVDNGGLGRGDVNTARMVSYGEAVNLAAHRAQGDRLLILNNDILVHAPFLHLLGQSAIEGPTHRVVDGDVSYIEGWCLSISHALWDMLGGFDVLLKNSWEDVDLSWRAMQLGFPLGLVELPITHLYGQTRGAVGPEANRRDFDNMRRFQAKKQRWELFKST